MPPKIPHVQPGNLPLARDYNAIVDAANAGGMNVAGPLQMQTGTGGTVLSMRDPPRIEPVRLTGEWEREILQGVKGDVISCTAQRLWYRQYLQSPPNTYGTVEGDREIRVYHTNAFPGDLRADMRQATPQDTGQPLYGEGDDVYAIYNPQSGRWELIGSFETIVRFELTSELEQPDDQNTPKTADAKLIAFDPGSGEYVDVADVPITVASFMRGMHGPAGTRGYAKRMADSHLDAGWEVIAMDVALIRKAEVYGGDLVQGSTSAVGGRLLEYVEGSGSGWWTNEELIDIYAGPSFRGVAFGRNATDPNGADLGDRVDVYYSTEAQQWIAITGGHWMLAGTTAEEMPSAGTTVDITVTLPPPEGADGPDAVPREVVIEVYSRWRLDSNKDVVVAWNTAAARWEVIDAQYFALGCGLKASYKEVAPEDPGGPKAEVYEVDLNEVAGPGLAVAEGESGECGTLTVDVDGSCGLSVDEEGKLVVVPEDLAGMGLEASESGCALNVDPGCGLGFDEQDRLAVDVSELAGAGLTTSTCALDVDAGCGLTFGVDGSLQVDPSDLVGTGLGVEGEGCKLGVKMGCGIVEDEFGGISVDTPDLVGRGLEHEGADLDLCKLAVKPGCGVKLNDEDDAVEVDAEAIAGSGLVQEEGCAIGVDATPDDDLDESLTVLTAASLSLDGCHVKLQRKARTIKFRHNADGFIIGVEIGEEQSLEDSTVDVSTCCCAEPTLYELQKCGEAETSIIVAGADLTDPQLGSVHRDDNGDCWEVTGVDVAGEPTAFAETANYPAGDDPCGDCQAPPEPTYYELTRCDDPESVILVDGADLTNPELGSVHKSSGDVCWEVTGVDVAGEPTAFAEAANYPAGGDPCGDCQGGEPDPDCFVCDHDLGDLGLAPGDTAFAIGKIFQGNSPCGDLDPDENSEWTNGLDNVAVTYQQGGKWVATFPEPLCGKTVKASLYCDGSGEWVIELDVGGQTDTLPAQWDFNTYHPERALWATVTNSFPVSSFDSLDACCEGSDTVINIVFEIDNSAECIPPGSS